MSPVGGPRHFDGPGLGQLIAWKCPACGADNSGPLEAGCQLCGSGRPGTHVGQAPPATAESAAIGEATDPSIVAYEDWWFTAKPVFDREHFRTALGGLDLATLQGLVKRAFVAGFRRGHTHLMNSHSEAAEPKSLPGPVALPFPVEGKAARTLIAALRAFIDTLFMEATDEIDSGEWCSVEEAKALIAQLEAHTNG